jgi:hypothetical protein
LETEDHFLDWSVPLLQAIRLTPIMASIFLQVAANKPAALSDLHNDEWDLLCNPSLAGKEATLK